MESRPDDPANDDRLISGWQGRVFDGLALAVACAVFWFVVAR